MKPLSLQLYSVRAYTEKDFGGTLTRVADMGYKGVEWSSLHHADPRELRKAIDDLGLVSSSAHIPLPTRDSLNQVLDVAKTLGYDIVISGKGPDDFKNPDAIRAAADDFQQAALLLKPHGITLGYHNHWWEFEPVGDRLAYEIFLDLVPDVVSQLDIYWACHFGDVNVPALTTKHASRIPLLHIKDGPLVRDEPHTAVGAGKMDIPACVNAADPDVLQWLIVELDHCATDMIAAVRDSCTYMITSGLAQGNPARGSS